MSKENREVLSDWMTVFGAAILLGSLFLTWSHQFSAPFLAEFGPAINGVPRDPTAWQVYSAADIVLALLAVGLLVTALFGSRGARLVAAVAAGIAVAFVVHALAVPPTDGANIFNPALSVPAYAPAGSTSGPGETVALIGLLVALVGLAVSFTAE
ncbi:MAG TPA: hypothetical protein VG410_10175 [Solirubrobacteraceae bacterium]|jgi:hypothetical protein|nr:hypothetical protein [Solirubrobacteraceae bacterium]